MIGDGYLLSAAGDWLMISSSTFDMLFISAVGLLIGLAIIYDGFLNFRRRRMIEDTPTSEIHSLAMGPVEIEGTVEPVVGTCPTLFGEECVLTEYTIEYPDPDDPGWNTETTGIRAKPFYIDDGTGKVLVNAYDIDSTTLDLEPEDGDYDTRRIIDHDGTGTSMPDGLAEFRNDAGVEAVPDSGMLKSGRRRYTQNTIQPGETLFAFGEAIFPDANEIGDYPRGTVDEMPDMEQISEQLHTLADQDDVEAILCNGDGTPVFFIANQDEDTLIAERKTLKWKLPLGALITAVSAISLLSTVGIL